MRVLVTGGAGYIGAHTVLALRKRDDEVVVVDNFSTGRIDRIPGVRVVDLDLRRVDEQARLTTLIATERIDAVVHLAAKKRVDESMHRPAEYALANIGATAMLLASMRDAGCHGLVFSSTAAVYGDVDGVVSEDSPTRPISPYGWSKLAAEELVSAASRADGLRAISLRYFNVAGANEIVLAEPDAMNLVPQVLRQLATGGRPQIFGDDYPTADGTCVRDFVHIDDVVAAHLEAVDALDAPDGGHRVFNVGSGGGSSVAEVIDAVIAATGAEVRPEVLPRRAGDSATVVADVSRIRSELGWAARHGLDEIVASAIATGPSATR